MLIDEIVLLEFDRLALNDHAAMAIDFKGEGYLMVERFYSLI